MYQVANMARGPQDRERQKEERGGERQREQTSAKLKVQERGFAS